MEAINTVTDIELSNKETIEKAAKYPRGYWALIAENKTGQVKQLFGRSKYDLAKELEVFGSSWTLLGAFKGSKLDADKKFTISFR